MASSNMASAASGFVLSLNVAAATTNSSSPSRVMFPTKNNSSTPRFVVRASDEAAAPATATPPVEGEAKPKPPPIGPKRGSKRGGEFRSTELYMPVKILRKESYWYKGTGSVVAVDQVSAPKLTLKALKFVQSHANPIPVLLDPKTRYPVVVRFNKVNYANVSTNNYALDEIEELYRSKKVKVM
ncbi:Photosystem I reaction center subunit IV A, chloroplastic [Mucuna pruriens]|uniref:Photosystem I reaction center subunit IV A, chloroplastic n=1 Tax=Mucuna pruriens TaxID=157652 RepID=A0A371G6R2_MUCPR|nr:Photosystem I reaction center subunit IV A, chloroplastic [Mucuna pruriens]